MGLSVWQILIIAVVVILLFGRGKISDLMGDVAKGINSFKKGLAENDDAKKEQTDPQKTIEHAPAETVANKETDQNKAG